MIKNFCHKGLENFFRTGSMAGIITQHAKKLRFILAMLDTAEDATDMDAPGLQFHKLVGDLKDTYAISVNGNWRITFKFEDGHAEIVNYQDYH
jgi:proteic killer suppression protein